MMKPSKIRHVLHVESVDVQLEKPQNGHSSFGDAKVDSEARLPSAKCGQSIRLAEHQLMPSPILTGVVNTKDHKFHRISKNDFFGGETLGC